MVDISICTPVGFTLTPFGREVWESYMRRKYDIAPDEAIHFDLPGQMLLCEVMEIFGPHTEHREEGVLVPLFEGNRLVIDGYPEWKRQRDSDPEQFTRLRIYHAQAPQIVVELSIIHSSILDSVEFGARRLRKAFYENEPELLAAMQHPGGIVCEIDSSYNGKGQWWDVHFDAADRIVATFNAAKSSPEARDKQCLADFMRRVIGNSFQE